jgi:hypothetical protein
MEGLVTAGTRNALAAVMKRGMTRSGHERELAVRLGATMIVGAGVVIATLARTRVARRRPADAKREALATYLREHLSGADLAMQIVERLRRTDAGTDEHDLFETLYREFEQDRDVVTSLLTTLGASSQSPKRLASQASGSVLKLLAGGSRGQLALFRTLEALAIGVQGKRCMWRALQSLRPSLAVPGGRTLPELEAAAVRQWDAIEERRRLLAPFTFEATVGLDRR